MKIKKALLMLVSSAAMVVGMMPGMNMTVQAQDNSTEYTLTIPATLTVAQSGWNATDGITAQVKSGDIFDSSKKLTVTAASTNSWALKSGDNSVSYNLATTTGTYSSTAAPASWAFSAAELNETSGTNKAMGIIVEDYSSKPAGTYQDTVTFTAKVEDAVVIHTTLAVGDVIHLGEVLSISTKYFGGGQAIVPEKSPFTLVRANVTSDPMSSTPVTEAEDGQYYVLKGIDDSYCVYIGTPGTSKVEATSTSDGIIVNTLNGNRLYFTTHEPQ